MIFNLTQHLQLVWTVLKRNLLCHSHLEKEDFSKECSTVEELQTGADIRYQFGETKGHRCFDCHTHLGQFYIYMKNHCGSRAILGLHVNGFKMLFFVYCLSIDEKSFFGTYALNISSLTSSLKYISEKYNHLWWVFFWFFFSWKLFCTTVR